MTPVGVDSGVALLHSPDHCPQLKASPLQTQFPSFGEKGSLQLPLTGTYGSIWGEAMSQRGLL